MPQSATALASIRTGRRASAVLGLTVAAACLTLALAGCAPETATGPEASAPAPAPSGSAQSTAAPSEPAPSASPDVLAALPVDCQASYSPGMLHALNDANPPLNHPGVTMNSTEVVGALELLHSGVPTLRCSWGAPSSYGLATNVTLVTPAQASAVEAALRERGFACAGAGPAETRCEITESFSEAQTGETHVLRGNVWVATHWVNFAPDGYTDDILATLFP
ncbi:MAG TPA: hypothetical protein PKH61_03740 [Microbacteriaceae bacterium]|jgi:hypothetical protein|nr:hypothetical protein [Microbacteriaceae bacterium]HPZ33895.1 hypothetical protein [Microbacteriaceae bacterium]HQC92744.1 hypothetical protein [Microbacteriaceae bacterium]